jgi:hypothetical protein
MKWQSWFQHFPDGADVEDFPDTQHETCLAAHGCVVAMPAMESG